MLTAASKRVTLACLAAGLPCLLASPASAQPIDRASVQTTVLMSRAIGGGLPDGPSTNPAVSDDLRDASVLTFQSSATNLVQATVSADTTNVFYIPRRRPYVNDGSPWMPGPTLLASRGRGGPANGSSYDPVVDGLNSYSPLGPRYYAPHCIAFLSDASNLVPHDTNHATDAFVYWLRSRRLERVSVGRHGRQANGATTGVAVNGDCSEVAFVSSATNLARGTHGAREVYLRYLGGLLPGSTAPTPRRLVGATVLVSATRSGHPANADSFDPAFGSRTPGDLLFVSRAANLTAGTGGVSQIYLHRFRHAGVRLVTRGSDGRPGNGDSDEPSMQDIGTWAAFRTRATNLAGPTEGHSQIARTQTGSGRFAFVSTVAGAPGDGDSSEPHVTNSGFYVSFTTDASNLATSAGGGRPDSNGASDVYLWTGVRHLTLRESVASVDGTQLSGASADSALSEFANYVFFDSADSLADRLFARTAGLLGLPPAEAQMRQVFMRYLGPEY